MRFKVDEIASVIEEEIRKYRTDVDLSRFKPKRGPTAIWWVQVRNARGQVGWTRHAEAFDGKDRLG